VKNDPRRIRLELSVDGGPRPGRTQKNPTNAAVTMESEWSWDDSLQEICRTGSASGELDGDAVISRPARGLMNLVARRDAGENFRGREHLRWREPGRANPGPPFCPPSDVGRLRTGAVHGRQRFKRVVT